MLAVGEERNRHSPMRRITEGNVGYVGSSMSLHGFGALDVEGYLWRFEQPVEVEDGFLEARVQKIFSFREE
jgi:hypothetical protein